MSHFPLVVIGDDVDGQLAPYCEELAVEPYRDYEEGSPSEFWLVRSQVREGHLTEDEALSYTWPDVVALYRSQFPEECRLQVDADDPSRAYEMTTYNPKSKWDWYSIGGRWRGYFRVKEGVKAAVGTMGVPEMFARRDNPTLPGPDPLTADVVRAGDVDWDGWRAVAAAEAEAQYTTFEDAVEGEPVPYAWDFVRDSMFPGDVDAARAFYREQPFVRALQRANLDVWGVDNREHWCITDDPGLAYVRGTSANRQRFVARASDSVGIPFAVLKEGEWVERGRMGWFGISTGEMDGDEWTAKVQAMLRELPSDTWLTAVDCHI